MRTGQRYIHKATFANNLSGNQTTENLEEWADEVMKVAEVRINLTGQTSNWIEYTAEGKWK